MSTIEFWFDNMLKLLKPGGRIIINFPTPKDIFDRYHIGFVRYTPEEIIEKLERRDCKIIYATSNIYNEVFSKYQTYAVDYGYNIVAEKL